MNNMTKLFIIYTTLMLAAMTLVAAGPDPGHSPAEIGPGAFSGTSTDTWTFPGKINAMNIQVLGNITGATNINTSITVSYTHLTLPTIYSV